MGRHILLSVALYFGLSVQLSYGADLSAPVISKSARVDFAKRISADVTKLSDLVLLPHPSDIAWVDAETAEINKLGHESSAYGSRLVQLNGRPEFKHVRLRNFLTETRNSLECVLKPGVSVQREMYCWGIAAFLLGDSRVFSANAISDLQQFDRVVKDTSAVGNAAMYEHYSRDIYEKIVVRYLGNRAK